MTKKESIYYIYTYNISKLNPSKKVRFVYALKGRNKEAGLVKKFNGRFLAPGCFIIPLNKNKEMSDVFKYWNIKFKKIKIAIK